MRLRQRCLAVLAIAFIARDSEAARSASGTTEVDSTTIEWAWIVCLDRARQGFLSAGSTSPVPVSSRMIQSLPNAFGGMVKLIGSLWALKSSRK